MKLFYFLCMVCFLICNSSCSDLVHDGIDSQNQYRTFSISGKIIHENKGLDQVLIIVSGNNTFFKYSNDSGKFKVEGLPKGVYKISVLKNGYKISPETKEITVNANIENFNYAASRVFTSQLQKLTSDTTYTDGFFGTSVGMLDDYVIVGAPGALNASSVIGAAYIFRRLDDSSWSTPRILVDNSLSVNSEFGASVALTYYSSRYYAIVGAPGYNNQQGSVYIYIRDQDDVDNWSDSQNTNLFKLQSALVADEKGAIVNLSDGDRFGEYIAASHKYIAISAPGAQSGTGMVYLFNRVNTNEWNNSEHSLDMTRQLLPSDIVAGDSYGTSIDIDGDYVIVGAKFKNGIATREGAAYVFYQSFEHVWNESYSKLISPYPENYDNFGASVAIMGEYAVVGAPLKSVKGIIGAGQVYVFKRIGDAGWGAVAEISSPNPIINEEFGTSIAINSKYVFIGATGTNSKTGSVYVFAKNLLSDEWEYVNRITNTDGVSFDYFGCSVAADENNAVIGGYKIDVSGVTNAGAAFMY